MILNSVVFHVDDRVVIQQFEDMVDAKSLFAELCERNNIDKVILVDVRGKIVREKKRIVS